jgi:hypothetical protein
MYGRVARTKEIPSKTQLKIKVERRNSRWLKVMEMNENSEYECGGQSFRRRKVVETRTGRYRADCDMIMKRSQRRRRKHSRDFPNLISF